MQEQCKTKEVPLRIPKKKIKKNHKLTHKYHANIYTAT